MTFFKTLLLFLNLTLCCMAAKCNGKFINPITDVCWNCLFPMTIGGVEVAKGNGEDFGEVKQLLCQCLRDVGGVKVPVPGIPISFWEPVRLVDVTREAFCLVGMGGLQLMTRDHQKGTNSSTHGESSTLKHSFYHTHYYVYPLIYWLELLTDFVCLEKASVDVAFLSEFDPFWDDDEGNFILNPDVVLFSNPLAQLACAGDCALSTAGFGADPLFWCAGCHGGIYPLTGSIAHHVGGVSSSLLITQRLLALMHRFGVAWGTSGKEGLCDKYPMFLMKKTQYKTQMVFPTPMTQNGCHPFGRTEIFWGAGVEVPMKSEDFCYLIWRKRNCCLF